MKKPDHLPSTGYSLKIEIDTRALSWNAAEPDIGIFYPSVEDWEAYWPDGRPFSREDYRMLTNQDIQNIVDNLSDQDPPEVDYD